MPTVSSTHEIVTELSIKKEGIEILLLQRMLWFADELRKREIKNSESPNSDS